jgi:anaerobic magnesium-protoporphyrin IX monomethyl ester cyclase
VVGLSIMTFQRHTAFAIMDLVRSLKPDVQIVVGGYDPSLAWEVYADPADARADFIVRKEGEITFRELLRAMESQKGYGHIAGLSFRQGAGFVHNEDRKVSSLDGEEIRPPRRDARVLSGYTFFGQQVDVVETSRGCTFDCSFCSIIEMRGRNFYKFGIDRVIADIRDAHAKGAKSIFFVDDNITLNVRRFEALCQAIIDSGLTSIEYTVQATTASIANQGETLAPLMRKAGFRYVFLGIENVIDNDLGTLKATAKNSLRVDGRRGGNASTKAVQYLHDNGMVVVGGLIVGNPNDTREDIEANLDFARRWVDWPYIQHPTPYPRTPMAVDYAARGLIENLNVAEYDGTTSVVACENLSGREIEYMRWRTERWIKVRFGWTLFRFYPSYFLRNALRLGRVIFRGSTIRSLLGLASEREAFERYCAIRTAERKFL